MFKKNHYPLFPAPALKPASQPSSRIRHWAAPARALPRRFRRPRLLIVGCGDVGMRLARELASRTGTAIAVTGITRESARLAALSRLSMRGLALDLDQPAQVRRLAGLARWVIVLAPPAASGFDDPRIRRLLAATGARRHRLPAGAADGAPRRWVYVSTTGVYGDSRGATFDESRPPRPASDRARRRVAAENRLRRACATSRTAIVRAPGIYAQDRLPDDRLRKRLPALAPADDVYTNHIHALDLARACLAALWHGRANRVYHAVDDSDLLMGDYFDQVADALALARPPRASREQIGQLISPAMLSFMSESRRLLNRRLKRELRVRLRYPTVADTLAALDRPAG